MSSTIRGLQKPRHVDVYSVSPQGVSHKSDHVLGRGIYSDEEGFQEEQGKVDEEQEGEEGENEHARTPKLMRRPFTPTQKEIA